MRYLFQQNCEITVELKYCFPRMTSKFEIKHEVLCKWLWLNKDKQKRKSDVIMAKIKSAYNYTENEVKQIKEKLNTNFLPCYERKWKKAERSQCRFKQKFQYFLEASLTVEFGTSYPLRYKRKSDSTTNNKNNTSVDRPEHVSTHSKVGRPRTSYDLGSERTKRRRVQDLRSHFATEELSKAAVTQSSQTDESATENALPDQNDFIIGTLAMYMDLDLSRDKYNTLRSYNNILLGNKHYPSYDKLLKAKTECYPNKIYITERGAEVELQSLLDHTAQKILKCKNFKILKDDSFILNGKWGMDGASGQQTFKQMWSNKNDADSTKFIEKDFSDKSVFCICYVPLELSSKKDGVIWKNDRPSSVRYCRPIKFEFTKESTANTREEYLNYSEKIKNLLPTNALIFEKEIQIIHHLQCTMIDGKVCNVLTEQQSSSSCNICGAKPKDMNNLERLRELECKEEYYKFGLSTLHCWIRFMEYLLHIGYNLDFKKGAARGDDKILKQKRKEKIQKKMKEELSISVDFVKQGYGTSNDGNTARSFFSKPEIVSKILGVDHNVIERFANILQAMASGYEIDVQNFETYCIKTFEYLVKLYPWYCMPPSVHKVLIHGSSIIKAVGLSIGSLSEEAQEASNKVFKSCRALHSRKCSRQASNEDILHHLLISSDPQISSIRTKKDKKCKDLSPEAISLLHISKCTNEES